MEICPAINMYARSSRTNGANHAQQCKFNSGHIPISYTSGV